MDTLIEKLGLSEAALNVYRGHVDEVGTSGTDPQHLRHVIESDDPSLWREKMSMLHAIMEWLPEAIQQKAGMATFSSKAQMQAHEASMSTADWSARVESLEKLFAGMDLDFEISLSDMAAFSRYKPISPTVAQFYGDDKEGRLTNTVHFQNRENWRAPWVLRDNFQKNGSSDLAQPDPDFARQLEQGGLANYKPLYTTVKSDLLNGSSKYVVDENDAWFQENKNKEYLIAKTGPSFTADVFIRLMNIFNMPLKEKLDGIKALIAHMHLDDHHSKDEVMSVTDGDRDLNEHLRYDRTRESYKRLDPGLFEQASLLHPQFTKRAVPSMNRLELERRAVNADAKNSSCDATVANVVVPAPTRTRKEASTTQRNPFEKPARPVPGARPELLRAANAESRSNARPPQAMPTPEMVRNAACEWLNSQYEALSAADRQLVDNTVGNAKLTHKTNAEWIQRFLKRGFPETDKLNGSTRIGDKFNFEGICTTLVPESPVVMTFAYRQNFYGIVLNPERVVPILAGNRDTGSDCQYVSRPARLFTCLTNSSGRFDCQSCKV